MMTTPARTMSLCSRSGSPHRPMHVFVAMPPNDMHAGMTAGQMREQPLVEPVPSVKSGAMAKRCAMSTTALVAMLAPLAVVAAWVRKPDSNLESRKERVIGWSTERCGAMRLAALSAAASLNSPGKEQPALRRDECVLASARSDGGDGGDGGKEKGPEGALSKNGSEGCPADGLWYVLDDGRDED